MTTTAMSTAAAGSGHDQVVAAAGAIVDRLAANADASERARRLEPDSIAALAESGLSRLLTPRRYGGLEGQLRTQTAAATVLAHGDPAASWVQMVLGGHDWVVGSFPEACQDEVFGPDPDVRIPGTLAAQGRVRAVDGGWLLDGRWQFCSGVDHGRWLLIGAVADVADESPDRLVHVVVPKDDVEVDDTWFTLGLRGTGSKDVVARDVFVPRHRSMPSRVLLDGRSPHATGHATNLYQLPVLIGLSLMLDGVVLGTAQAALRLHVERTRARREIYTGRAKAQGAGTQMRIARSAAELTTAELLLARTGEELSALAASGRPANLEQRAELKFHTAYVAELCRRATERIFDAAGAHSVYDESRLQALHRDVSTACHHATIDIDTAAEMYGRVTLGLDPGTPLL
jgi:alkylation response protein AidB-like acyl-CoA dehydrogenase